jgi:hypothetical protein
MYIDKKSCLMLITALSLTRFVVVSLVSGAFVFSRRVLLNGLRPGRIAHTDASRFCDRRKNSLGYWCLVALFFLFFSSCTYVWIRVTYDVLKN